MFPDRLEAIKFHSSNALKFARESEYANARQSFSAWIESIKQQNTNEGGGREQELANAKEEYSKFVLTDPLYLRGCDVILKHVQETPGILQTNLYLSLSDFDKQEVLYVLYFMADHGRIKREKKGRTYALLAP